MTLKSFVPPFALILTVMGTILAGVATPTEAAALGCVGAMILAIANRKFNWEVITLACTSTLRTTCMIMLLFIGGKVFSVVFLSMGGGDVVSDFLLGMNVSPYVVLAIMMAVVFFLGMFIDWAAILLVVVPIFTPIGTEPGLRPSLVRHADLRQPAVLFPHASLRLRPLLLQRGGSAGVHHRRYLQGDRPLRRAAVGRVCCCWSFSRDHHLAAVDLLRSQLRLRSVTLKTDLLNTPLWRVAMLPKIQKILYATGLGAGAPHVFRYALSLARQYEAEIIAVHGMEPFSPFAQSLVELHVSHEKSEEMHRQAREAAKEASGSGSNGSAPRKTTGIWRAAGSPESASSRGSRPQVVLQEATAAGADVIVMGSHRHTVIGEKRWSEARPTGCCTAAAIPVLVVRIPEGFREEGF